jgi:hypothetical protein
MMGMGYDKPEGGWKCFVVLHGHSEDFSNKIEKLLNDDWEMHGNAFVIGTHFCQVMVKFEPAEYETGDDDDGLPLPEAGNEPIEQVRNCS